MILVAGVGNIFFGDDSFGCEVVWRMIDRPARPEVRIVDFGIRSLDLAYALTDPYDAVIIVDAVPCGGVPGTIYVIEPELEETGESAPLVEAHTMDPVRVLLMARSLGADLKRVRIVGCEPQNLTESEEGTFGLSPQVEAAVVGAIKIIESEIEEALAWKQNGKSSAEQSSPQWRSASR